MSAILPRVKVFKKDNPINSNPGMASKIALVGAFENDVTSPVLCTDLEEAYELLGTDKTYNGVSCLDKLFFGASSVLAVNITTRTGSGSNITIDKTLTTAKLTEALAKIKGEDFDMLFIASSIEDTALAILTTFLDEIFTMKCPAGYVACISRSNSEDYVHTAQLAGDFSYGLVTQQLSVDGTELSLIDSGAYYCGVLASLNVGNSMTMKVVPGVTAISPELSFENGDLGLNLLQAGITTFKCQNREEDSYIVVNSEQPNGLDLYINRVRDFVVKEMSLHQFLGERNRTATLNEIKQEVDGVKERCVKTLDLLEDIGYTVEKRNPNCVDININSLLFNGIITEIDVYITIEVE